MSRKIEHGFAAGVGFPRVSGDEPLTATSTLGAGKFSPRERG